MSFILLLFSNYHLTGFEYSAWQGTESNNQRSLCRWYRTDKNEQCSMSLWKRHAHRDNCWQGCLLWRDYVLIIYQAIFLKLWSTLILNWVWKKQNNERNRSVKVWANHKLAPLWGILRGPLSFVLYYKKNQMFLSIF